MLENEFFRRHGLHAAGPDAEQVDYVNAIQVMSAHEYLYYRPGSGLRGFVETMLSRGRG